MKTYSTAVVDVLLDDVYGAWLRESRPTWTVTRVCDWDRLASLEAVCGACGTRVDIRNEMITLALGDGGALRCPCDEAAEAAAEQDRAWREHFGLLAEAFA